MSSHSVTVRHNFETGHRLPHLTGKCESLHGHSWWAEIEVSTLGLSADGTVVEYGALKQELRGWIDRHLDHGLMLGRDDPLSALLDVHGKVFIFDPHLPLMDGLPYPTVEAVAILLSRVTEGVLYELRRPEHRWRIPHDAHCSRVTVHETHVNQATWRLA